MEEPLPPRPACRAKLSFPGRGKFTFPRRLKFSFPHQVKSSFPRRAKFSVPCRTKFSFPRQAKFRFPVGPNLRSPLGPPFCFSVEPNMHLHVQSETQSPLIPCHPAWPTPLFGPSLHHEKKKRLHSNSKSHARMGGCTLSFKNTACDGL